MIKPEEIKKLIKSGFDLELISFELDIPIEEVIKCKEDMEKPKQVVYVAESKQDSNYKADLAHSKMKKMRENYKKLFYGTIESEVIGIQPVSEEETELIEKSITKIEHIVQKMQKAKRSEQRGYVQEVLEELKGISKCTLSIQQAGKLYELMRLPCFEGFTKVTDPIIIHISKARNNIITQFIKAIELKQYEINDIEGLQELSKKITISMMKENPMTIPTIKNRISSRISELKKQMAIDEIRNDIPLSIESIIIDLVNGNIDMQKANAIIDAEVRKREEGKTKNKFALTAEQERNQILIQIRTAIEKRAEKYNIQNPNMLVLQLRDLCKIKLENSINVVVQNLISRGEFELAKNVCDKFSKQGETEVIEDTKYIIGLRNQIRNAEISKIVLKAIGMEGKPEEDIEYLELIEKSLRRGDIKLSTISLGKSKDGKSNITLQDIWAERVEDGRLR